jgi:hypothetical protein
MFVPTLSGKMYNVLSEYNNPTYVDLDESFTLYGMPVAWVYQNLRSVSSPDPAEISTRIDVITQLYTRIRKVLLSGNISFYILGDGNYCMSYNCTRTYVAQNNSVQSLDTIREFITNENLWVLRGKSLIRVPV